MMVIELLYAPGCQSVGAVREAVARCLAVWPQAGPLQEVVVVNEEEARRLKFPGSPTLRVNGRDIEPGAEARPSGLG